MTDPSHIDMSWVRIPIRPTREEMDAFLAVPSRPMRGGLVMLQEIFGVNEAMREKARDFAPAGFSVIVPDLFWRTWIDPSARARSVIYDPDLTVTLPKHETATTGMNCLAHCIRRSIPPSPIRLHVCSRSMPFAHWAGRCPA